MKRQLTCILAVLAGGTMVACGGGVQDATPELHVDEFGVTEGKPVDSGLVFYDAGFVEPPYVVTRRGTAVFINDLMVTRPRPWPLPDLTVDEDPPLPDWVNEETTWDDMFNVEDPRNGHLARKTRYLRQHYPQEEAIERMTDYYRELPFVESVEERGMGRLRVRTKDGETRNIIIPLLRPGSYSFRPPTREEILSSLNRERSYHEKWLGRGNCMFFSAEQRLIMLSGKRTCRDLPVILAIAGSDRPQHEKVDLLTRVEFTPEGSPFLESLAAGLRPPPEVYDRLTEMCRGRDIVPRTIEDLPEETYMQRMMRLKEEKTPEEETEKGTEK